MDVYYGDLELLINIIDNVMLQIHIIIK